jgi:hypothetical protein
MAAETSGATIRVSGNSDFRTSILLEFYGRLLPVGRVLVYYPHERSPASVDWYVLESLEPTADVPPLVRDRSGQAFVLVCRLPFYGLSGSQWSVYRSMAARGPGQ